MMPNYRQFHSFGQLRRSQMDEYGLVMNNSVLQLPTEITGDNKWYGMPWVVSSAGEITDFLLPDGSIAQLEDKQDDAELWEQSYSRDARALHSQNHDHACTDTCFKKSCNRKDTKLCRFLFYVILVFTYLEGLVQKTTRILRRGHGCSQPAHGSCSSPEF